MSKSYPIYLVVVLTAALSFGQTPFAYPASVGARTAASVRTDDQICDPVADYYLGMEDYPKAVRLHEALIQRYPGRALAYYHLGFAYGVLGNHDRELLDYQKAVELGLSDWELFLNLGRLYLGSWLNCLAILRCEHWHGNRLKRNKGFQTRTSAKRRRI